MKLNLAPGVVYTVANGSTATLSDVNAGGIDVPALSVRTGITLTTTELAAILTIAGVAVTKDVPTHAAKRSIAHVLKYRATAAGAAL